MKLKDAIINSVGFVVVGVVLLFVLTSDLTQKDEATR